MATKKNNGAKSAPLDPKVADKLLDLLSTDNEFRRLFKKDPGAALAKVGYKPTAAARTLTAGARKGPPFTPPGPPPVKPPVGCMQVQRIAPKADIIKARSEIKAMLTTGLPYITPSLDATITASRLTRK